MDGRHKEGMRYRVDASVAPLMDDAQLYMSGMNFTFNPNRLIFNKVTEYIPGK